MTKLYFFHRESNRLAELNPDAMEVVIFNPAKLKEGQFDFEFSVERKVKKVITHRDPGPTKKQRGGSNKISDGQREKILSDIAKGNKKLREIAAQYGVSEATIYNIKARAKQMKAKADPDFVVGQKTEEQYADDKKEMTEKYGKTAVNNIIDMYMVGNDVEKIHKVHFSLDESEIQEVIDRCV